MSTDPTPEASSHPPTQSRSGAVTAVAIVNFILGALQLLCGGVVALGGGALAAFSGQLPQANGDIDPQAAEAFEQLGQIGGGVIAALGIAYVVLGILLLIAGYGVLKRRGWGRTLTLVLGGVAGVLAIIALLGGEFVGGVTNILYAILVFVVLLNARNTAEFS